MIGSFISFSGYLLALLVLTLWMVVRIWRRSPLLAILSFLFWPASIIALISNWGDEDSDIRVPFALTLVAGVLMGFMAMRTVDKGIEEMAMVLSDEEIELIRADDPELAAALEQARAEAGAANPEIEGAADEFVDAASADDSSSAARTSPPSVSSTPPVERDPAVLEAAHRASLEQAAMGMGWQFGRLDLSPAAATLPLPAQFRFAPRSSLLRLARLRNIPLPTDVLGWLVHRDVDLAREDAWYVQLRFRPLSAPIAPPDGLVTDRIELAAEHATYVGRIAKAIGAEAGAQPQAPVWDAANGIATWERAGSDQESAHQGDYVAARVLPDGVLEFVLPDLHDAHAELGRRSVRLMALRALPRASHAIAP